jgi:hypothetical protein
MFREAILPLALAVLITAIGGLFGIVFKWFEKLSERYKKIIIIVSLSLILLSILVLIIGLVILPSIPANLTAEQTSIAATSTEIANLIQFTQIAGTNAQWTNGTQTATAELAIADRATAVYSTAKAQVAQQVRDNAVLCSYATNPAALEAAASSQKLLLWPLGISVIAFIIFLIASYQESKSRKFFIAILVLSIISFAISLFLYTNHPLSKLPQGFSFSSNSRTNQLLLEECNHQREQQTNATQTSIAAESQRVYQTQTRAAVETEQANSLAQMQTATAIANMTATQTAFEVWYAQHQFVDEFVRDEHGWTGDSKSSHVELNRSGTGILIYESKKESRISFWRCDLCSIPDDYQNYSFEIKYLPPDKSQGFNFGFVFGCSQFDEDLVSCHGIKIVEQSQILILRTGTSKIYDDEANITIRPNVNGLISIRWEVKDQVLNLWVNDKLTAKDIKLDGPAGGMFGFYAEPPGSTVSIEKIDINPLP